MHEAVTNVVLFLVDCTRARRTSTGLSLWSWWNSCELLLMVYFNLFSQDELGRLM